VGEFGIITYLIQYIMIKNLYKENGNSRRHFFDQGVNPPVISVTFSVKAVINVVISAIPTK
jgi:hypothetical protein